MIIGHPSLGPVPHDPDITHMEVFHFRGEYDISKLRIDGIKVQQDGSNLSLVEYLAIKSSMPKAPFTSISDVL